MVVAVYDACVLWPPALRDLLVRLAITGCVRARWSERILDETFLAIRTKRADLDPVALARTRRLLATAVRDASVEGYEPRMAGLELPDPDDRHVLAAALHGGATVIVTFNLADFPAATLSTHGIEARHPDDFVLDILDISAAPVLTVLHQQASALRSPPRSVEDVVTRLERSGLVRSMARIRSLDARLTT